MTEGFFLFNCNFNELIDLATRTYRAFGSTQSSHMALSEDEKAAGEHFGQFLDPHINDYFCRCEQDCNDASVGPGTSDESRNIDEREEYENDDRGDDNTIGITHLADINIQFGEDCP